MSLADLGAGLATSSRNRDTTNAHKRYIVHTVRYTNLAPDRFKSFWRD